MVYNKICWIKEQNDKLAKAIDANDLIFNAEEKPGKEKKPKKEKEYK